MCARRIPQKEATAFSLEVVRFSVSQRSLREDSEHRGMRRDVGPEFRWLQQSEDVQHCK